jgi:hypothetical protein
MAEDALRTSAGQSRYNRISASWYSSADFRPSSTDLLVAQVDLVAPKQTMTFSKVFQ